MTVILPTLTEEEIRSAIPADEEAGFGSLATARGHLPLVALDVQAHIDGLVAEICVAQTFRNALAEPLEATYIFPLPDRAAVTRFRMEAGGRVIEGVLKERAAARQEYDQAIQAGHRAAITEEERPGVFTIRVGNLLPGEEATIRLNLVGPLPYADGEATFRFPLVVAPRYIPGVPLAGPNVGAGVAQDTDAVPDASRISPPVLLPGFPNPVRLALAVDLRAAGMRIHDCRSSLHAVVEEQQDGGRQIRLQPGERLDRDFILRFRLGVGAIVTSLAVKPDEDNNGSGGTFFLTLIPPADLAASQRPRDIVFVLDRSGSMEGWKMVAARRAIARMVDTLTDRDRFTVLAFDDKIERPPDFPKRGLHPASNRNRFRAVEFLAKIDSRGGTEMAAPLETAVQELAENDFQNDRHLVLVTDGQVGNEDQILRKLNTWAHNIRVFALGIDRAVNAAFLQRLAGSGGACELVESEERLDEVMEQVHRRIGTATLTHLHLESAGLRLDTGTVVPTRLPDLFAGAPAFIMGRCQGASQGSITLEGTDAAGKAWSRTVQSSSSTSAAIPALWARGQVRELEDKFVVGERHLEKRIVEISLQFGVLCRFTAFVAVDRSEVTNRSGETHKIVQPVELPSGWERPAELFCLAMPAAPACASDSALSTLSMGYASNDLGVESPCLDAFPEPCSAPPPPPSKSRRSRARIETLGAIGRLFKRAKGNQPAAPDLTLLRRQASALAARLSQVDRSDRRQMLDLLRELAIKVESLLKDLRAAGAADKEFAGLDKLHQDLLASWTLQSLSDEYLKALWIQADHALRQFAGEAIRQRREEFWK